MMTIEALKVRSSKIGQVVFTQIIPKLDIIFFFALFLGVIKKAGRTFRPDLIYSTPFITFDGFQWMTDALHYLDTSVDVTQRNPALPIVFAVLRTLGWVDWYPALSACLIWVFYFAVFRLLLCFVNKAEALFTTFCFLFVFRIHSFFDYILADPWCLTLSTLALGELFRCERKPKSFLLFALFLGLSFNFQFAPAFFAPALGRHLWCLYKRGWVLKNQRMFWQSSALFVAIVLPQFIYKWVAFGSPLYSHVVHFPLLDLHFWGLPYYALNFFAFLGIPLAVVVILGWWHSLAETDLKWQSVHAIFSLNFFVWILLYKWLDTRFLLYLVPQWVCYFAYAVRKFELNIFLSWKNHTVAKNTVLAFVAWYSLSLASYKVSGFEGATLPISPQNVIHFNTKPVSAPHVTYALDISALEIQNSESSGSLKAIFSYFTYYKHLQNAPANADQEQILDHKRISAELAKAEVHAPTKIGACGSLNENYETRMRLMWTLGLNISQCGPELKWNVIFKPEFPGLASSTFAGHKIIFEGSQLLLLKSGE